MASSATAHPAQTLRVEFDREADGRWIADIPDLPGVTAYGSTKEQALSKVQALAFRVLADKLEQQGSSHTTIRFKIA